MDKKLQVSEDLAQKLKNYVYLYLDPRDDSPFYIGKGKGNRLYSHLEDQSESEKVKNINLLRDLGLQPKIEILRYGLTEEEAILVEATAIDLIGLKNLSNVVSGHHSKSYGRIDSKDLFLMLNAEEVVVIHPSLLITINKLYNSDMSELALYEATRGVWRLGKRREQAKYAFSIYQGIVREVYEIQAWYPAATLKYLTRSKKDVSLKGRWEFTGKVAEQNIRDFYMGKFVGYSGQNPVRYANIL